MALQVNNYCGFESEDGSEAVATSGSPTYPTTDPATGVAHLSLSDGDTFDLPWIVGGLTDQGNDYIVQLKVKPLDKTTAAFGGDFLVIRDSADAIILRLGGLQNADVRVFDANGVTIRTITDPLDEANYTHLAVHFQHSATATVEVFVDGSSQGQDTNQDVTNGNSLNSSAVARLEGPDGVSSDWRFDDVVIFSGAADAGDRKSAVKINGHFCDETTDTADNPSDTVPVGPTALDSGTWDNTADFSTGRAAYTASTADGGADGVALDAEIVEDPIAMKFVCLMQRSGGGGSEHYVVWGNNSDGNARSADLDPTASDAVYEGITESASLVPLASETLEMGFEKDAGGQDFDCLGLMISLLHVPSGATTFFETISAAGTGTATVGKTPISARTIAVTGTGTATVAKISTFARTIAATGTATVSLIKKISKTISAAGTGTASVSAVRIFMKVIAATGTGTVSLVKKVSKTIAATGTGTVSLAKKISKTIAAAGTGTVSLIKKISKTITSAGTGTATVTPASFFSQSISSAAIGTASVSTVTVFVKVISAAGTGTASLIKKISKTIAATGTGTVSLIKKISKMIAATGTGSVMLTMTQTILQTISATATGTASVVTVFIAATAFLKKILKSILKTILNAILAKD